MLPPRKIDSSLFKFLSTRSQKNPSPIPCLSSTQKVLPFHSTKVLKKSTFLNPCSCANLRYPPQRILEFFPNPLLVKPRGAESPPVHERLPKFVPRSHLFDPKLSRFMSSLAGEPPQRSSPKAMNGESTSPVQVVSTLASPFDESPPHIDASSSIRKPLSLWPGMYHSPVTNALWEARSSIFERLLDPSNDGPPQTELLTRTPSQSRTSIIYYFSSDYILREQYRDPRNEVRIGKLLEDLDALAGTISVKLERIRFM